MAQVGPAFAAARAAGQIDQFHNHRADRRTVLRLHRPDQFGDDVTTFRPLVRSVFETGRKVIGLETGLNGTAIRAIVPVRTASGAVAGVVEIGAFVTDALLAHAKPDGVEIAMWRENVAGPLHDPAAGRFVRLGRSGGPETLDLDASDLARVASGERVSRRTTVAGVGALDVACAFDWRGAPTGAILTLRLDLGPQEALTGRLRGNAFAIVAFALLAFLGALWFVLRRYVAPVDRIVDALNAHATGDFSARTPLVEASGRTGDLARSVERFRQVSTRLAEAMREAERANMAKTDFLANFSHELRTPLNAIIGFSDIMRSEAMGALPARYRGYSADIHDAADHLLKVVSDIIDLQRIEKGALDLVCEPVDLCQIADSAARLLAILAERHNVAIRVDLPENPVVLPTDPQRVSQIVINLVSNATKYSHPGGKVVLGVRATDDGGAELRVADTGVGMSAEEIGLAMRPFGLTATVRRRPQDSIGLGLPIVRGLVEALGGRLTIDSRKGEGTVVTVVLPAAPAAAQAAGPPIARAST
jgi:signal transduction histidine kinase